MKYSHNQICTRGNEIEVGKIYQYKEDNWIADVKIIEDQSDENGIGFKLEILNQNYAPLSGPIFTCWAATGMYGYSGMWRLFDANTYWIDGRIT